MDVGKVPCETPLLPHGYFALSLYALEEHFVVQIRLSHCRPSNINCTSQDFLSYFITFEWLHLSEKLLEQLSPATSTIYLASNARSDTVFVFNQDYFQRHKELLMSRYC